MKWLQSLAAKLGVRRPLFRDVGIERAQALSGLLALCPLPPEAIAEVTQLTNDPDQNIRLGAKFLLGFTTGEKPMQLPDE